jgi:hypothetical protein
MSSKLSKTNPHLRDPVARERAIVKSVASSSAIEGIRAPFKVSGSAQAKSVAETQKRKS